MDAHNELVLTDEEHELAATDDEDETIEPDSELTDDKVSAIEAEILHGGESKSAGLGVYSTKAVDAIEDDDEYVAKVRSVLAQPLPPRADGKQVSNGAASARAKFLRHTRERYIGIRELTADDIEGVDDGRD